MKSVAELLQPMKDRIAKLRTSPTDQAKLIAAIEAVESLAEKWRYKGEFGWGAWQEGQGPDPEGHVLDEVSSELRAALTQALGGDGA